VVGVLVVGTQALGGMVLLQNLDYGIRITTVKTLLLIIGVELFTNGMSLEGRLPVPPTLRLMQVPTLHQLKPIKLSYLKEMDML